MPLAWWLIWKLLSTDTVRRKMPPWWRERYESFDPVAVFKSGVLKPLSKAAEEPETAVNAPAIKPPVHDSAVVTMTPFCLQAAISAEARSRVSLGNMGPFSNGLIY